MNISEAYKKYPVHKGLQEHMIRVAAVAKQICDQYADPVDTEAVVSACLLHDMGNLIKVKFEILPELFEPEGVEYWQQQQAKLRAQYSSDVEATIAIIRDLGVGEKILKVTDDASFEEIVAVAESGSLEAQLLEYSDMRVGLNGIIALEERFADIRERYVPNKFTLAEVDGKYSAAKQIETAIFSKTDLTPDQVTDESTREIQAALWSWEVR